MSVQKMYKVDYSQYTVEGDNYAGFTGYRDRSIVLMSEAEYREWMKSQVERNITSKNVIIKKIACFTFKPSEELNVATEVANMGEHIRQTNKAREIKELEAEQAKVQQKLKALKK